MSSCRATNAKAVASLLAANVLADAVDVYVLSSDHAGAEDDAIYQALMAYWKSQEPKP